MALFSARTKLGENYAAVTSLLNARGIPTGRAGTRGSFCGGFECLSAAENERGEWRRRRQR
jgi:hypothetical protein